MARKITLFLMLAALVGAVVYGWLFYGIVGLYDEEEPKISYIFITEKPEWDTGLFYNHVDKVIFDKEIKRLKRRQEALPEPPPPLSRHRMQSSSPCGAATHEKPL